MDQKEIPEREASEEEATLPVIREHIVATPGTCGGKPRIAGHRIRVQDVAIWHERMGMSVAEIVHTHPSITRAEVHAALAYYYDHRDQIEADIRAGEQFAEQLRAEAPPSPLQRKLAERGDPFIGMMADEPELAKEITEEAMKAREARPLRQPSLG